MRAFALALVGVAIVSPAFGQGSGQTWTPMGAAGTPPAVAFASGNTNESTDRLIVFGGENNCVTDNATHVLNNANGPAPGTPNFSWISLAPSNPPPARAAHAAGYHPANNQLVIFGGFSSSACALPKTFLNDAWALTNADGSNGGVSPAWTPLTPAPGPAPAARAWHSAVLSPPGDRLIVFGGATSENACGNTLNDVWALKNVSTTPEWEQLPVIGGPSARKGHTAVIDRMNNRMIVFGGDNGCGLPTDYYNDVWVLSGIDGSAGTPTWSILSPGGGVVPIRTYHSAAYTSDPALNSSQMVIFGGVYDLGQRNDTWVLTGANGVSGPASWSQVMPSGTLPPLRERHVSSINRNSQNLTVFGGIVGTFYPNDIWVLSNALTSSPPATNPTLTVTIGGTGTGSVSSSPPGITCPPGCSAQFASGAVVTLTLAAGPNSTITNVTNCTPVPATNTCTVTLNASTIVTVTFDTLLPPTDPILTIATGGAGTGSVSSNPPGITCPPSCSSPFPAGTFVTLTAFPAPGHTVSQWFSCTPGPNNTCSLTLTQNTGVTVIFNAPAQPAVLLSTTSLAFGKQRVGMVGATEKIVNLQNTGTGTLTFTSFNGQAPAQNFTVGAGDYQVEDDCPLAAGLPTGGSCNFRIRFSPTVTGPRDFSLNIGTNAVSSPHLVALSGLGFMVNEAIMLETLAAGGARVGSVQNVDGGWEFLVGAGWCGGSCANTIGVTALGLVAAYVRESDATTKAAILVKAKKAGDLLLTICACTVAPPAAGIPKLQDVEFLKALADISGDVTYQQAAANWFQALKNQYPTGASRLNAIITEQDAKNRRSTAGWQAASLIRAAKAVGDGDYATAVVDATLLRFSDWADMNPAHRFDVCGSACSTPGNRFPFDDTVLSIGSFLAAIHDIAGYDATISQHTQFLLAQQDGRGSWLLDPQVTAYAMLGLAAVGGSAADTALRSAIAYLVESQLPSGGWGYPNGTGGFDEYSEVDAEDTRAMMTLFNTPLGGPVTVSPSQIVTVTFTNVTSPGLTTMVATNPATVADVTGGFQIVSNLNYEVRTTAAYTGDIRLCFSLFWINDQVTFNNVQIMHGETVNNVRTLVDRTITTGPFAPDFATRRKCALVTSLSPFSVVKPDTTKPSLSVTLSPSVLWPADHSLVTIDATVTAIDDVDPAPKITLVSITSNEPDNGLGDGDTAGDIRNALFGSDDRSFQLRAERSDKANGRTYTVVYRATDRSGNSQDATAIVVVPHSKPK